MSETENSINDITTEKRKKSLKRKGVCDDNEPSSKKIVSLFIISRSSVVREIKVYSSVRRWEVCFTGGQIDFYSTDRQTDFCSTDGID